MMRSHSGDLFCRDLPTNPNPWIGKILVTGATGYIGGRLVPELLQRDYRVRVMARESSRECSDRWPGVEVVVADALDLKSLKKALSGIHTAYYLIHSMLLWDEASETADIRAAANFRQAAEEEQIKSIIYLGSFGDFKSSTSKHLKYRARVSEELKKGKVPATTLFSSPILGSGSSTYELIEHLVRNCHVLPTPPWASSQCQPIAVRDVIKYLVGVLEIGETAGKTYEIGGPDVLSLRDMLKTMTEILGKRRFIVTLPFGGTRVFGYLASLFTPVPMRICHCLLEYARDNTPCRNEEIKRILPFPVMSHREAILRALSREEQDRVATRWSDAYPPAHELALKLHELKEQPTYTSCYSLITRKRATSLFRSICRIGGKEGWFNSSWLWRIRGAFDRIIMGVGSSRGRKSASSLAVGDVLDFWRVEDYRENERLLLRAEMKLPGRAWLEFRIEPVGTMNRLAVTAHYQTAGVWGRLYWYAFLPFHVFIFRDLIRQIERQSADKRIPGTE